MKVLLKTVHIFKQYSKRFIFSEIQSFLNVIQKQNVHLKTYKSVEYKVFCCVFNQFVIVRNSLTFFNQHH
jgi:hypothetical protein